MWASNLQTPLSPTNVGLRVSKYSWNVRTAYTLWNSDEYSFSLNAFMIKEVVYPIPKFVGGFSFIPPSTSHASDEMAINQRPHSLFLRFTEVAGSLLLQFTEVTLWITTNRTQRSVLLTSWRIARWKWCIEPAMGKGHRACMCSLVVHHSHIFMFAYLGTLQNGSFWLLVETSWLRLDWLYHYPLMIDQCLVPCLDLGDCGEHSNP